MKNRSAFILNASFLLTCFCLPIVAVLASKGLVVVLIILAAACLPLAIKDWGKTFATIRKPLILVLVFLAWAFVSGLWAVAPVTSLRRCADIAGLMLAGFAVVAGAMHLRPSLGPMAGKALLAGVLCALALILGSVLIHSVLGHWWFGAANVPAASLLGKNGCTVLAVLTPLLAVALWRQGARGPALIMPGAVALSAYLMESHTSIVALALGGLVILAIRRMPRLTMAAIQAMVGALALLQPLAIANMPDWDVFSRDVGYLPNSAYHRYYIWKFTVGKIFERPILGWGLDASRELPEGGSIVMKEIAVPWRSYAVGFASENLPLHPHNVFLQWWLELGGIGAALATVIILWLLRRVDGLPAPPIIRAGGIGAIVSGLVVGQFSFGAWQSWMLSFHWLTIVLFIGLLWGPVKSGRPSP